MWNVAAAPHPHPAQPTDQAVNRRKQIDRRVNAVQDAHCLIPQAISCDLWPNICSGQEDEADQTYCLCKEISTEESVCVSFFLLGT